MSQCSQITLSTVDEGSGKLTLDKDPLVPLMLSDPSDLGSLIRITTKEHTLNCPTSIPQGVWVRFHRCSPINSCFPTRTEYPHYKSALITGSYSNYTLAYLISPRPLRPTITMKAQCFFAVGTFEFD